MTGTAAPETGAPSNDPANNDQKPTETVEFWKAQSRENEKRAKANADAATRLAALEEAQKSETEKLADAKAAAEKATVEAKAEALRWRIAAKHGISDEDAEMFLSGTDEATLTKQAERLAGRVVEKKKTGNHVPKEGATHAEPKTDDLREFVRGLFGQAD